MSQIFILAWITYCQVITLYQRLSARLQKLECVSNEVTAILHKAIDMSGKNSSSHQIKNIHPVRTMLKSFSGELQTKDDHNVYLLGNIQLMTTQGVIYISGILYLCMCGTLIRKGSLYFPLWMYICIAIYESLKSGMKETKPHHNGVLFLARTCITPIS